MKPFSEPIPLIQCKAQLRPFFVLFWNPFVGPISAYVQPELNRPSTDLLAQQKQDLAPFIFPGTRPRFMHADLVVHVPSTLFSIFTCMAPLHDSPTCSARLCPPCSHCKLQFFFASTPRPTLAQMLAFTLTLNNRPRTRRSLPLLASNGPCFAPAYLRSYSAALNTNYQLLLRAFWRQDHLLTKHHRLSGSSSCVFTAPCKSRQVGCPSLQPHGTRPFVEVACSTVPGKVSMPLPFPMQRSSTPKL